MSLSQAEKDIETSLTSLFADHDNSTDLLEADSCYHRLTHLEDVDTGKRTIDLENVKTATFEAFDKWDVLLSDEEEKSFYKNHFDPTWAKFQKRWSKGL